jgi:hypothetical protein
MVEIKHSNGARDIFDPMTGVKTGYVYPKESPIQEDFFWPDGTTVKQRSFKKESKDSPYRVIFCDEQGKAIQAEKWDGTQVKVTEKP